MTRGLARRAVLAACALAPLAGCPSDKTGTIALGLTTAPGSPILDGVTELRLTFTNPRLELTVPRTERGFDLSLDLEADGSVGALVVNGHDAGGALVATGATPPFPLNAIDARILVYMATPMSVGAAPPTLEPARTAPSVTALSYGAILMGGTAPAGGPSGAVQIYNAYDHSLVSGLPLPGERAGATLVPTANNGVLLFGGTGPGGAPTGTLWYFDTITPPAGAYGIIVADADPQPHARTGQPAVRIAADRFLIAGAPAIELASAQIVPAEGVAPIAGGASVTSADGVVTALLIDEATGALRRLRGGTLEDIGTQRRGGAATGLPGGRLAVLGGEGAERDAVVIDVAIGAPTPIAAALAESYIAIVPAATRRFLVVAGVRAAGGSSIEILDAGTLARRQSIALDDAITAAIALPNEQVLLVGARLHLFTPPPAE